MKQKTIKLLKAVLGFAILGSALIGCGGGNSSNLQAYKAHQAQIEKQKQRAFKELDNQ